MRLYATVPVRYGTGTVRSHTVLYGTVPYLTGTVVRYGDTVPVPYGTSGTVLDRTISHKRYGTGGTVRNVTGTEFNRDRNRDYQILEGSGLLQDQKMKNVQVPQSISVRYRTGTVPVTCVSVSYGIKDQYCKGKVRYGMVRTSTVPYGTEYFISQYDTIPYSTVPYCTAQVW